MAVALADAQHPAGLELLGPQLSQRLAPALIRVLPRIVAELQAGVPPVVAGGLEIKFGVFEVEIVEYHRPGAHGLPQTKPEEIKFIKKRCFYFSSFT